MDNRQFNVKGLSKSQLQATIALALMSEYEPTTEMSAVGWKYDDQIGLVIYKFTGDNQDIYKFMSPAGSYSLTQMIWAWLDEEQAKNHKITDINDIDLDHDGHNRKGFRIEKTNAFLGALFIVTPAFCWYGK